MNWLTRTLRPKLKSLSAPRDVPDNLWVKCPACGQMIYRRDLENNLYVCPHCGHHHRLPVKERLKHLFDDGRYKMIKTPSGAVDPLKFKDTKKYADRLREAREKTQEQDCVLIASGDVGGIPTTIGAFDFAFMGGSMGISAGEAIVKGCEHAVSKKQPFVMVVSSGGARMQEGILSLMQMARTTIGIQELKAAGLPYIVILSDPTTGGVSASFAMLGDIHIAEPGSIIGFAGARVIEQTIREKLPEGFQRAEYLKDHGMVDMVVARKDLPKTLAQTLSLLLRKQAA